MLGTSGNLAREGHMRAIMSIGLGLPMVKPQLDTPVKSGTVPNRVAGPIRYHRATRARNRYAVSTADATCYLARPTGPNDDLVGRYRYLIALPSEVTLGFTLPPSLGAVRDSSTPIKIIFRVLADPNYNGWGSPPVSEPRLADLDLLTAVARSMRNNNIDFESAPSMFHRFRAVLIGSGWSPSSGSACAAHRRCICRCSGHLVSRWAGTSESGHGC